ncbi:hypothetical protein MAP00_008351 [Monascus purpureus]|nr:hypothetical protein MAP00_008351 [Monascus purpureus]
MAFNLSSLWGSSSGKSISFLITYQSPTQITTYTLISINPARTNALTCIQPRLHLQSAPSHPKLRNQRYDAVLDKKTNLRRVTNWDFPVMYSLAASAKLRSRLEMTACFSPSPMILHKTASL